MLGVAAGGRWRPSGNSGVPVSAGESFCENKAGGGIAVNDAGRDIQLLGQQCVHAEPSVVNFSARRLVAIETRQAGGGGIQIYARSRLRDG